MSDEESSDIEKTGSTTKQMRAVRDDVKEAKIRAEYETKAQAKLEKTVYSTRERVTKLEKRQDRTEWFIGAAKYVGGPIVLAVIGLIARAVVKMITAGAAGG